MAQQLTSEQKLSVIEQMVAERFSDRLGNLLMKNGEQKWRALSAVFFVILLPILILGGFSYLKTREDLTRLVVSQRQNVEILSR